MSASVAESLALGIVEAVPFAPQRPELGIERVDGAMYPLLVNRDDFPWMSEPERLVSLRQIHLVGGQTVLYGSLVGANNTLRHLADQVCKERSLSAEAALFTSMPQWLEGHSLPPHIDVVPHQLGRYSLFKAGRGIHDPARLFFSRVGVPEDRPPVILKLAIAKHKDQSKVVQLISGMRANRNSRGING